MAKNTATQALKRQFGSKDKLAAQLASDLTTPEGITQDEFQSRLKHTSPARLLRIARRAQRMQSEGTLDKLELNLPAVQGVKLTPLQRVQRDFGSKEKLAAQLATELVAPEGYDRAEFQELLQATSNRKLLRLAERAEALKAEGGFDQLAQTVTKLEKGNEDRLRINQAKSVGQLLDRKRALSRK
jgi:hypothetical protein